MFRPKYDRLDLALMAERGSYWEMKIRGKYDIDVYEDDPDYSAWTVGFRLVRDTTHGGGDVQDSGT